MARQDTTRTVVVLMSAAVCLSILIAVLVAADLGVLATRRPSSPGVARYSGRTDRGGYEYWKEHGKVVAGQGGQEVIGRKPLSVPETAGVRRIGRVAVDRPTGEGMGDVRWLLDFFDGFEFHQKRLESTRTAELILATDYGGLGEDLETTPSVCVAIGEHVGYLQDVRVAEPRARRDGTTVYETELASSVSWNDGPMLYTLVSPAGEDHLTGAQLLRIARTVR